MPNTILYDLPKNIDKNCNQHGIYRINNRISVHVLSKHAHFLD